MPSIKSSKIQIDFKLALEILKKPALEGIPNEFIEETPAVITHWLQSSENEPLLFPKGTRKKWLGILSGYIKERNFQPEQISFSYEGVPFPPPKSYNFTFIDLFAGIGGFRLALQEYGGKCVFSSDWDKGAKLTYFRNYGEIPFGNIKNFTDIKIADKNIDKMIPDHDILAAGFPCQPFSRAGVSARVSMGRGTGFADEAQGTLFFDIVRIVKVKKPKALYLENVKNLKSHDGGKTFLTIQNIIEKELKYSFEPAIIDSSPLVPQKRQRCYMVAFRDKNIKFKFPEINGKPLPLRSILEENVPDSYTISDRLWLGHQKRTERNIKRGTGFTAFEADLDKPANTLVARYGKDGKECLIPQKNKNPRKLTRRECARLQGYPDKFIVADSNAAAYRQFGNSVAVPVVKRIAKDIVKGLK